MVRSRVGGGPNVQEHRRGVLLSLLQALDQLSTMFQAFLQPILAHAAGSCDHAG
jgi:hypothetical protein